MSLGLDARVVMLTTASTRPLAGPRMSWAVVIGDGTRVEKVSIRDTSVLRAVSRSRTPEEPLEIAVLSSEMRSRMVLLTRIANSVRSSRSSSSSGFLLRESPITVKKRGKSSYLKSTIIELKLQRF